MFSKRGEQLGSTVSAGLSENNKTYQYPRFLQKQNQGQINVHAIERVGKKQLSQSPESETESEPEPEYGTITTPRLGDCLTAK